MGNEVFKAVVRQGFVPIFVAGTRDVEVQLSGCRDAGLRVIEYTQRREDSAQMIPSIVRRYPDMRVLVGSTLDDDAVVRSLTRRFPHLRTLSQLAALGASGFVSRMSFSAETCRAWRATHLLMPCAGTVNEAYRQFCLGAHIIKVVRSDYEVVRQLATTPAFGFCPLFVPGGMNLEPANLLETLKQFPDPPKLESWEHAVRTRENVNGVHPNVRQATRSADLLHLASLAVRLGRKINYDPVKQEIVGDPEATRMANPPRRAPWTL